MKFESDKDYLLNFQDIGTRRIYVVSERLLFRGIGEERQKGFGIAVQITPIYIVILEAGHNYALSLETGKRVDVDQILLRIPSLRMEIFREGETKMPRESLGEEITFQINDYESPF